jgi:hypothetical protein
MEDTFSLSLIVLLMFISPIIIAYKTISKQRLAHIIFTELLLAFYAYFITPLGQSHTWSLTHSLEYWLYCSYVNTLHQSLTTGYVLAGCAFFWSVLHLKRRWYESEVFLYYELIVFIEFILLIPLVTRVGWGI